MLDSGELLVSALEQQRHGGAILDIGGVYFGAQHQAASIDQDVTLAAIDALGSVVATYATHAGRPDGLAVDDARARVGVAPDTDTELLAQDGVQVLPRAIQTPQPEVVIGGLPGRELMRQ